MTAFKKNRRNGDHLGNVRLSYSDADLNGAINPNTEIIEESNYYPFGLQQKGYNNNVSPSGNALAQKFKYNGVELNESLDLNLYEMDLRQYDPAIARWTSIDPVTHFNFSTYTAFDNNPVFWADPSGADAELDEAINNAWNQTPDNGSASFDNEGDCNCGCPGKPPCAEKKDVKDMSAGEFYAMAYNGASLTAYLNGNDPYNPTDDDIAQNEKEMQEAAGELFLLIAGEYGVKLIFQGGKWVYTAIRIKRAGNVIRNSASAYAKANRIYSGQKHFSKQIADGYLDQMRVGTFDDLEGLSGLFDKSGRTIVTGGNHRINAAIRYGAETGNYEILGSLMTAMRVTQGEATSYGYKVLNIIK